MTFCNNYVLLQTLLRALIFVNFEQPLNIDPNSWQLDVLIMLNIRLVTFAQLVNIPYIEVRALVSMFSNIFENDPFENE